MKFKARNWFREEMLFLAAAYFFCGAFGLSLASINKSTSAFWPPTGLALAVLLLKGRDLWPGVFLGAFLINISTQGTMWTSLGIALGNTLEAYSGAWLVSRYAGGDRAFDRIPNVFGLAFLAGIMSTAGWTSTNLMIMLGAIVLGATRRVPVVAVLALAALVGIALF